MKTLRHFHSSWVARATRRPEWKEKVRFWNAPFLPAFAFDLPSGQWPDGTGESPVPPFRNPIMSDAGGSNSCRGSVLIVVLWIVFGLVAITLYFANSMTFELRASDNRVAGIEAEQAIEGARRYFTCVLSNVTLRGAVPDPTSYQKEAVQVGNAHFWLIGRGDTQDMTASTMHYGLLDESSKLNLNIATSNMLMNLPRMTEDVVANILTWRSTNTSTTSGGAQSETYLGLMPPYLCKNKPFETVDELRLIYNMTTDIMYGEDANLNGVLDPNENDGDATPPTDNLNGQLDPGLLEYVTVYTREPANDTNGLARVNVAAALDTTTLTGVLTTNGLSSARAAQIVAQVGPGPFTSVLQFYLRSGMTSTEFMQVEGGLRGANVAGLININTANTAVLACLPGLTNGQAAQITAYRQQNITTLQTQTPSVYWVTQVGLATNDLLAAAPYLTGRSYQYTADVAAVGHNGRGYRRTRFVFDVAQATPTILHRQDLSHLGWALGKDVREKWLASN